MAAPSNGQVRDLVVTEIGFNGIEFLEFRNLSDADLDLHGYTVFGGIDAFLTGVLAPGEHAVIVSSESSFRGQYGLGPRVLLAYQRKLDDLTENIVVRDPDGIEILSFVYKTAGAGWPRDTNEEEFPLELIAPENPETNLSLPSSWRRSFARLGSPGQGSDCDADGLDDAWEMFFLGSLDQSSTDDPDGDDLDNGIERRLLTSPISADSDSDGLADNHETLTGIYVSSEDTGTDPINRDSDDDGLFDRKEVPIGELVDGQFATDPNDADSDNDSHRDGDEVLYLGDPLDPGVGPRPPVISSFSAMPEVPHAGEPIYLEWEIAGSSSRTISPFEEGSRQLSNLSTRMFVLPATRKHLIQSGSVWRYNNSVTDYGVDWRDPEFDDSSWSAALAPFGYYNSPIFGGAEWVTDLPRSSPTTYFRGEFLIPDRLAGNRLEFVWSVASGGALYLNGDMIKRHRLPVQFNRVTPAEGSRAPEDIVFSPDPMPSGVVSIGSESHIANGESFGAFFDLGLNCIGYTTGDHTFTLQASNPYGTVEKELTVQILDDLPASQSYSEWASVRIPSGEDRAGSADLDGDGFDNLMEFLTGSHPRVRTPHPISMEFSSGVNVSFTRHRNPVDAGLRMDYSKDGIHWETLPVMFDASRPAFPSITVLDETRERLTYRVSSFRRRFFRLRAINVE